MSHEIMYSFAKGLKYIVNAMLSERRDRIVKTFTSRELFFRSSDSDEFDAYSADL